MLSREQARFMKKGIVSISTKVKTIFHENVFGKIEPLDKGMGRNISEIVSFVSRRCCDAAGKFHHTYWPQPTIIVQSDAQNQGNNFKNSQILFLEFKK